MYPQLLSQVGLKLLWATICGIPLIYAKLMFLSGRAAQGYEALHRTYGSVVQVSPGYLSTNTTEALRDIYGVGSRSAKTFRRSDLYKGVYRNSIGTTTDPAYHAAVRKLFVPSFQPGRLKEHEAVMKACIGKLHNLIKSKMQQNDTLVLNELFHSLSVDLVMEVLLGKSSGCLERGGCPMFWATQLPRGYYWATLRHQFQGSGVPTVVKWILRHLVRKAMGRRLDDAMTGLVYEQIRAGKDAPRGTMGAVVQTAYSSSLSESEVVHSFTAILMAGFDTVSQTLCVVIWLVFTHADTHATLAAELQGAFKAEKDITLDIARKLPWLNAVITEALRVFPPIPVGPPRVSPGAYVDNIYIPAGVEISTSLYALHRNPKYFDSPAMFKPERWITPDSNNRREAVQPFLIGPQSCIANHLAEQILQLTLASFFLEFGGEYVGRAKDWIAESKSYVFWELPELRVRLRERAGVVT